MAMSTYAEEVARGEKFEFGKNWAGFLKVLNEERITNAVESLKSMLEVEDLRGRSFLDIGSGSGLFSLAARRLGARVHTFDYDPQAVACAVELKHRYFPGDDQWAIEEGSALSAEYLRSLGRFDVVYSWGVLHHTGQMWLALENASLPVAPGGKLYIAVGNDMGTQSMRWKWIKRTYNNIPRLLRAPYTVAVIAPGESKTLLRSLVTMRLGDYARSWTQYSQRRGMNRWHDIVDWVGGHPYECATPDQVFDFYRAKGFTLTKLKCGGVGLGCAEYVFVRDGDAAR